MTIICIQIIVAVPTTHLGMKITIDRLHRWRRNVQYLLPQSYLKSQIPIIPVVNPVVSTIEVQLIVVVIVTTTIATIQKPRGNGDRGLILHHNNCKSWKPLLLGIDIPIWVQGKKSPCGLLWRKRGLGWVNFFVILC